MSARPLLIALVAALGIGAAACTVSTDLGSQCVMKKANPDGGAPLDITESDVTPGKDFISFGATECEDLVCVIDAAHLQLTGDPNAPVKGYCSRSCAEGSSSTCTPQQDPSWDTDPDKAMSCRALFLDPVTLGKICQADPQKCQQYFGDNSSPYFCARGSADGGTQ